MTHMDKIKPFNSKLVTHTYIPNMIREDSPLCVASGTNLWTILQTISEINAESNLGVIVDSNFGENNEDNFEDKFEKFCGQCNVIDNF